MEEHKEIRTVEIPNDTNIYDWSLGEGKEVIFPELLIGCEELLYHDLEKVYCLKAITYENDRKDPIDFIVRREGVENTLEKIHNWALDNEHYLMCRRVTNLQKVLEENE